MGALGYDPAAASGLTRYTGEMIEALLPLAPDLVVHTASPAVAEKYGSRAILTRHPALTRSDFRGNLSRFLWHQTRMSAVLRQAHTALYYCTTAEGMFRPPCPQVITVHDIIPLRFPHANPRQRYYYRYALPHILHASAAVVVDSASTERDVREAYGPLDIPIHVVFPGHRRQLFRPVPAEEVRRATSAHQLSRFVLAVGETRTYKNIRRLITAFAKVDIPDLVLAVVGKTNSLDEGIIRLPDALGIPGRVRFLGQVSDGELAALYSGAQALVFPSLYEGFGIPPLEAMACGCPVIASTAASIPEVCGEAAWYVDPYDIDGIATGISRVVGDVSIQQTLRRKGLERVQRFSYDDAARRVLDILQTVLLESERGPGYSLP